VLVCMLVPPWCTPAGLAVIFDVVLNHGAARMNRSVANPLPSTLPKSTLYHRIVFSCFFFLIEYVHTSRRIHGLQLEAVQWSCQLEELSFLEGHKTVTFLTMVLCRCLLPCVFSLWAYDGKDDGGRGGKQHSVHATSPPRASHVSTLCTPRQHASCFHGVSSCLHFSSSVRSFVPSPSVVVPRQLLWRGQ